MYESGMYELDPQDYNVSETKEKAEPTVEQVSKAAEQYADKIATQLSSAFEMYPLTKTMGISNRHIKNAFSVIGALALLNVARKNKIATAGLIGAGYIYAVNTKKAPKSAKEAIEKLA